MKFNITRFINLIKRDFLIHKKLLIYACMGLCGFLTAVIGINWIQGDQSYSMPQFWIPIFMGMLFIGGLTFTALVFRDFKTPAGRLQFLSLPASNFEKVFSRWIYSLILMPLIIVATIWIVSSFFITNGGIFDELPQEAIWAVPLAYILGHASTFLQALYFNKLVPFKVMISGTLVSLLVGLVGFGLFTIIFHDYFQLGRGNGWSADVTMSKAGRDFFEYSLGPKLEFILKFFLAPYLWVVSYFKMKEKEA